MKFYSEITRKYYDTADECTTAECEYNKAVEEAKAKKEALVAERKERAKEVENAYAAVRDAEKKYNELRKDFIKDYGSFHMTFSSADDDFFTEIREFFRFF